MSLIRSLFSINKTEDKKYKILTILGFKIKIKSISTLNAKKNNYYIAHESYINRKNKNVTRRLFITTGNYNLLNVLTLIKQLNKRNCEDVLIIISHEQKSLFNKYNKMIAQEHNFKRIIFLVGKNYKKKHKYFIKEGLYDFDEVYAATMGSAPNIASDFYPKSKKYLIDEGVIGYIYQPKVNFNDFVAIYMHNYSNKIDYLGFDDKTIEKFQHLDKNIFNQITLNIQKRFPSLFSYRKEEKTILMCGTCAKFLGLNKIQYEEYIKKIVTKLNDCGYNVVFKPHPREIYNFNKMNVEQINTPMPLECFDLKNIVAVISFCSLTATQILYLRNIPGFQIDDLDYNIIQIPPLSKLHKIFFFEYTPSYKELLFDCKNMSFEEIHEKLNGKVQDYLQLKDNLSRNKNILEAAQDLDIRLMGE